jgi:hypothetical protein
MSTIEVSKDFAERARAFLAMEDAKGFAPSPELEERWAREEAAAKARLENNERMEKLPGLKLYVWEGYFPSYTAGVAVAIAESTEEAKRLISPEDEDPEDPEDWGELTIRPLDQKFATSAVGGD